jgi:AraC-like DNA-binding protein
MTKTETIGEFYLNNGLRRPQTAQFYAGKMEEHSANASMPFNRRDFYKISLLVEGQGTIIYPGRRVCVMDHALVFSNPMIPYAYDSVSRGEKGYFCLFPEEFINQQLKIDSLSHSPLFKVGGNPVLFPDVVSTAIIRNTFEMILAENASSYVHKYDLLRNYVQIIIHESLKVDPIVKYEKTTAPADRLASLFLQLLERQFPLRSPDHSVLFTNAKQMADQLSVHPNHLNRVLKKTTGLTTSEHLSQRFITEAKAMLLYTDWDAAQIGYCLGFDHASNFYSFFKKQTGKTVGHFRKEKVANA